MMASNSNDIGSAVTKPDNHDSQFTLLRQRRFLPFFITQFLGAFNDNAFKNAMVILIAFQGVNRSADEASLLVNMAAALFILPFFLFSSTAGQIGDRFSKDRLMRAIKLAEIFIMGVAAVGFVLESVGLLLVVLFFMGTQSAVFGPVKYSYLPQVLEEKELTGGNGMVGMGTFLAILLGMILGSHLMTLEGGVLWVCLLIIAIAAAGYAGARQIPLIPPAQPDLKIRWNVLAETWHTIQITRRKHSVFLGVVGISWFWFLGSTYMVQLPNYTRLVLGGAESVYILLMALFCIGIGVGSVLCEKLSGRMVEIGLVPFGSIGLSLFGIDLYFSIPSPQPDAGMIISEFLSQPGSWRTVLDIVGIGVFGGFYIVPLFAMVQSRSDPKVVSRVIAGNNILNALFMVVAAVFAIGLLNGFGLAIDELLLLVALLNILVVGYIYTVVPEFLLRFIAWGFVHLFYRMSKSGLLRVPDRGGALLVANHVSLIDPLVISACIRRPIRYVVPSAALGSGLTRFFLRKAGAVVTDDETEAVNAAVSALRRNELVLVFPEAGITSDGNVQPMRPLVEKIVAETPAPVLPVVLRGMWGSVFSAHENKSVLRRWHAPVEVHVSEPLPIEELQTETLRSRLQTVLAANG